jgi:hypothetical protein
MPCHAMHPIQDLFLESFSYELQFDMHFYLHSYLHKFFYSCKMWVLRDLMRGIAGQLGELSSVLVHRHGPLFQILKLFLLQLDHSLGNTMCIEISPEFRPVDALGLLMGFHIGIPPIGCRTREMVRG